MPTFSPFRTLNLFRTPATKQAVNFLGGGGLFGQQVSTSSLDGALRSVPFWWLLRKLSFDASWTIALDASPNPPSLRSGSFSVDFVVDESPNDKICRTYLDTPSFLNLIEGGLIPTPNFAEITSRSGSNPQDGDYFPIFNMEAFQCEKVHALFMVAGGFNTHMSTSIVWYITSGVRQDLTFALPNAYSIFEQEINITLPNSENITLLACADFYDGGYGPLADASTNIQLNQIEWWEPE